MSKRASEVIAATGNFVRDTSGVIPATGTPADGVVLLVRIFIPQETSALPPYLFDIVGLDPEVPGT